MEELTIVVDNRELKSGVAKSLFEHGIRIVAEQLEVGDYILTDKICCERKSVKDFVESMLDGRLFKQAKDLLSNYEKPFIAVEGSEDVYGVRNIHPNAIRGLIASISLDMKIPIIFTKDHVDTALFFITILKREGAQKQLLSMRGERKPLTEKELMEYIVSSFPGVGRASARNLLEYFGSVKEIVNSSTEELLNVEGVGKVTAERFNKIINAKYK